MEVEKKQTVLMIHNYYQNSGGEDSVVENERQMLEKHGHTVIMYTKSNDELKSFWGRVKYLFSFLYSKRAYKEVRKLISAHKIEIVHVHNTFPLITASVYKAAYDAGVPVVQTLHNFRLICPGALYLRKGHVCEECNQKGLWNAVRYNCYRNSRLQTAMAVLIQKYNRKKGLYDKVTAYIALTEFNKRKFETVFPWCRKKIYVKPNFIEETFKSEKDIIQTNSSDEYIYVGRLSIEKGIYVLLKAFKEMPSKKLCMIGTGPLKEDVDAYIKRYNMNNIRILGFLPHDEVIKRISCARALIMPSVWYEGFPMTIVEAFFCGTPVIGSRLGNIQELLCMNENGLLFDAGSADDLAEKIGYLEAAKESYQMLRIGARNAYLQKYTEEKNYKRLLEIYKIIADFIAKHGGNVLL